MQKTITWKLHEKHSRDVTLLQGELILAWYLYYGETGFAKCIDFHGI